MAFNTLNATARFEISIGRSIDRSFEITYILGQVFLLQSNIQLPCLNIQGDLSWRRPLRSMLTFSS